MKQQKIESPGPVGAGTEAELEALNFKAENTPNDAPVSTFYWDREAHSVEPLRTGGAQ